MVPRVSEGGSAYSYYGYKLAEVKTTFPRLPCRRAAMRLRREVRYNFQNHAPTEAKGLRLSGWDGANGGWQSLEELGKREARSPGVCPEQGDWDLVPPPPALFLLPGLGDLSSLLHYTYHHVQPHLRLKE